jgi:predicted metal-dependent enzyme (double-stranded beta helix superfamily)
MTITTDPLPLPSQLGTTQSPAGSRTPRLVLERLAAHRTELLEQVRFDESKRWHQRLTPEQAGTDAVEVWLLSWLPGQESPLHDHGGSSGAFTVLAGALDETVVSRTNASRDHLWVRGPLRSFGEHHIHRVGNDGDLPAVSLHAYRPTLSSMRRFDRGRDGLVLRAVEESGRDW